MLRHSLHYIFLVMALLMHAIVASADDGKPLVVQVSTLTYPMPAAAMEYYQNAGKYFTVSLTNTSRETSYPVRLQVSIDGTSDSYQLQDSWDTYMRVNTERPIMMSFIVPPGQTRVISPAEFTSHMRQYPTGSVHASGLLQTMLNDPEQLGLMPEGHYRVRIDAVTNTEGATTAPLGTGECKFDICYKAIPPEFTQPFTRTTTTLSVTEDLECYQIDENTGRFAWTIPTFNFLSRSSVDLFTYDFRLYRLLPGQSPSSATQVAFQQLNLLTNFCTIPQATLKALKQSGSYFVAQVTARSLYTSSSNGNYVQLQNGGRSKPIIIKLSTDGEDDLSVDGGGETLPIEVEITPRYSKMPTDMEPYFTTPGQLFKIKLRNVSSNVECVSAMLQFYRDDWGVTPKTAFQHTMQNLILSPGEEVTLTEAQIENLMGDYELSQVVEFYPHTGRIIGPLGNHYFQSGQKLTAYCRVCRWQPDKHVSQETTIGKGRVEYLPEEGVVAGQEVLVKVTNKQNPQPCDMSLYFQNPSRLVYVKVENLTNEDMHVKTLLGYQFGADPDFMVGNGNADDPGKEKRDQTLFLPANREVVLTDEQVDEMFGNYVNVRRYNQSGTVKTEDESYQTPLPDGITCHAKLQVYRESADLLLNSLPSADLINEGKSQFLSGASIILRDIDVEATIRQDSVPTQTDVHLLRPGQLYGLSLHNASNRDHTLVLYPAFRNSDAKSAYTYHGNVFSSGNAALTKQVLKAGDTWNLTADELNEMCGREFKSLVRWDEKNSYQSPRSYLPSDLTSFGDPAQHLDITWRVLDYDKYESLRNDNTKLIADDASDLIGLGSCSAPMSNDALIGVISVEIETLMPVLPSQTHYYFENPSLFFKVKLTNTSDKEMQLLPAMELTNHNSLTVMGNYLEKTDEVITLEGGESVTLAGDRVNALFAGFSKYLYAESPGGLAATFTGDLDKLADGGEELTTTVRAFDYAVIKGHESELGSVMLQRLALAGRSSVTYPIGDNVSLGSVTIQIEPKKGLLDEDIAKHISKPGSYYDVTLINADNSTHAISLEFCYNDTYFVPTFGKAGRGINIAAGDTIKLTAEQLNSLVGGFKVSDIRQIDAKTGAVTTAKNPSLQEGLNSLTVSLLEANRQNRQLADTICRDTTSFRVAVRNLTINGFKLTVEHSESASNDPKNPAYGAYKGSGYITWRPMGFDINLACEFDSIWIDENKVVTRGRVNTCRLKDDKVKNVPFDLFDPASYDNAGATVKRLAEEALITNGLGDYYEYARNAMKTITQLVGGEPVSLPVSLDNCDFAKDCPANIQILSAAFTPDKSWINLMGEYKFEGSSSVSTKNNLLLLGAPLLQIHPESFLPSSGTLALMSDLTVKDGATGLNLTCKAPTQCEKLEDLVKATDGCFVSWSGSGFDKLSLDAEFKVPGLYKAHETKGYLVDKNGTRVSDVAKAASPEGRMTAQIDSKGNWTAKVRMDAFQVEDALGYTFVPTGLDEGILYDHDKINTVPGIKFHKDYNFNKSEIAGRWSATNTGPWMGLYWQKLGIIMPSWLGLTGKNDISLNGLLFDASGFTCEAIADLKTTKASLDGWEISLRKLNLAIVQNNFNEFGFSGDFEVPFLDGTIEYAASVTRQNNKGDGITQLQLKTTATKGLAVNFLPVLKPVKFDGSTFDLTYQIFDEASKHGGKESDLSLKLTFNGVIELGSDKEAGFHLPDIHFYNMYVANRVHTLQPKYASGWKIKWDGPTWHNGKTGGDGSDATLAFSLGNWSLASAEKRIGPFKFALNEFSLGNFSFAGKALSGDLTIAGSVNIISGISVGAGASVSLPLTFDFGTKKAKCGDIVFNKITLSAGSNLSGIKFEGSLESIKAGAQTVEVPSGLTAKGYMADFKIKLPGDIINLKASGAFVKCDEAGGGYYAAALLECSAESSAGIPIGGVVSLTGISGGFYVNCSRSEDKSGKPTSLKINKGMIGAMLGLRMSDTAGKLMNGGMKLYVFYDTEAYRDSKGNWCGQLSEIRLLGDLHAITTSATSSGLINAKAMILYSHTPTEHFFELSVTVSASGTGSSSAMSKFQDKINKFAGTTGTQVQQALDGAKANLQKSGAMKDDDSDGHKTNDPEPNEDLAQTTDSKNHCSGPSAEVNLELKVNIKKEKWYLHIGTPSARCKFTIIDFAFGNKTVGGGAKLGANAYICLGNDLPDFPPLPDKVAEYLGMTPSNVQQSGSTADTRASDVSKRIGTGGQSGFMMGAEVYGGVWCNALICYANVDFDAGFDIALSTTNNMICAETLRQPGKNGWYGQGQLYAYMGGEIGVIIGFFGKSHRYPIVKLALGGVLQAGLPNPTWFHGKFRASGSLFGGLIKFSRTVEVKAGNVCTPLASSPLNDIEIFADCTPGLDNQDDGHLSKNAVSPFSSVVFSTNMTLGEQLELMDENLIVQGKNGADSKRTFKFEKVKFEVQEFVSGNDNKNTGKWTPVSLYQTQHDAVTYKLRSSNHGEWKPNTKYRVFLVGRAYEKDNTGRWVNPYFIAMRDGEENGVKAGDTYRKAWYDTLRYYFVTGPIPTDVESNVMVSFPFTDGEVIYHNEAVKPMFGMRQKLMSNYTSNVSGKEKYVIVRVSKPQLKYTADQYAYPTWDTTRLQTMVQYRLKEETALSEELVRWVPDMTNSKDKVVNNTSFVPYQYDVLYRNRYTNGQEYLAKRNRYVMQILQVTQSQKSSARTSVDPLREQALGLTEDYASKVQQYANSSSGKAGTSRVNVSDYMADFYDDLMNELQTDKDTTEIDHVMSSAEKKLADHSEQVLWSREFYVYCKFVNDDYTLSEYQGSFNQSLEAAQSLLGGYNSVIKCSTWGTGENATSQNFGKRDYQRTNNGGSPLYYSTLLGPKNLHNHIDFAYDYSLLETNLKDPIQLISFAANLATYEGYLHDFAYIPKSYAGNLNKTSVFVDNTTVNGYQLLGQKSGSTWLAEMVSAKTSSELKNSKKVTKRVLDWQPTTYLPRDPISWVLASILKSSPLLYEGSSDTDGKPCFGATDGYFLAGLAVDHLKAMGKLAVSFVKEWNSLYDSFYTKGNCQSDYHAASKSVTDWCKENAASAASYGFVKDNYGLKLAQYEFDRRQIPFLFARAAAGYGYDGDNFSYWWTRNSVTDWTQRLFKDGKLYYFKRSEYLFNQDSSRKILQRMRAAKITFNDSFVDKWMKTQDIYVRYYRPNAYHRGAGILTVFDWDDYYNASNYTFDMQTSGYYDPNYQLK